MSERGSFITQALVYCPDCFAAVRDVLVAAAEPKFFVPIVLEEIKTIAGRVGGLWSGEERFVFDSELREQIEDRICHPVRIAIVCDSESSDSILTFNPARAVPS